MQYMVGELNFMCATYIIETLHLKNSTGTSLSSDSHSYSGESQNKP